MTNERLAELEAISYDLGRDGYYDDGPLRDAIRELIATVKEKDQTIKYLSGLYHEERGKDQMAKIEHNTERFAAIIKGKKE